MASGTVKWFNELKGYGFLVGNDGADVFVHYTQIQVDGYRTLTQGERVEYDEHRGPKGVHALRVHRIAAQPESVVDQTPRDAQRQMASTYNEHYADACGLKGSSRERESDRRRNVDRASR